MKPLPLTLLATALAAAFPIAHACTTIIVGNRATVDGSIIIARNNDSGGPDDAQNMARTAPRKAAGVFHSNSIENDNNNRFTWKLPPDALGYVAFPHWQSIGKPNLSFEETGVNDYGIALSATETIVNGEKALKADPYLEATGVTEDAITSIILPYATSAKDGVRLLGNVIEQSGAGEGFGVAFSDRNEAWYLETSAGHHWVAARVPPGSFFISANQGRLQRIDHADDPMNFLASPGLFEFAEKNGLYDPKAGSFNHFNCCIGNTDHDRTYNHTRVRALLKQLGNVNATDAAQFPVFVEPPRKLSVTDVIAALRNHYAGTAHDAYENRNPQDTDRPVSVLRTSMSHITQTRADVPDDLSVIQYIAIGFTDLALYVPFYKGLTTLPDAYQGATGRIDDRSVFWRYRRLQALVLQDYPRLAPRAHRAIAELEQSIAQRQAKMEIEYLETLRKDPKAAKAKIQRFTDTVLLEQDRLLDRLTRESAKALGLKTLGNEAMEKLIRDTEKRYHFHGA